MRSPRRKMDLLEVRYMPDPWKVLVSCVLLNRTRKAQVCGVIDELFGEYPSAERMARGKVDRIARIIGSLGLQNQRARSLKRLSLQVFEEGLGPANVSDLYGVGQYAVDAYMILFEDRRGFRPDDYALRNFLRYESERFERCPECVNELNNGPSCAICGWEEADFYEERRILCRRDT